MGKRESAAKDDGLGSLEPHRFLRPAKPLPPLVVGGVTYGPGTKPVLLLLPAGSFLEFANIETATAYLDNARRLCASDADQAALFAFQSGRWVRTT